MVTAPLWGVFIIVIVASIFSGALTYALLGPRQTVEVDRTPKKEVRPLNIFDAYSDKEMKDLRDEAARLVRYYREIKAGPITIDNQVKKLREIDDEIQARANAKLALEESKRTQHERDIAIFDTVYGEVIKQTDKS